MAEFIYTIDVILVWDETSFSRDAVSADVHWRAYLAVVKTATSVDRASLISDFVVSHPLKSIVCFTTVAALIFGLARNYDLWRNLNVRPCGVSCNLYSVRDSRSGSVSPA